MVLFDTNADNLVTLNCRPPDAFKIQIQFKVRDVMPAASFLGINAPLAMSAICSLASKTQNKRSTSAEAEASRKQEIKSILEGLNCPSEHEQVSVIRHTSHVTRHTSHVTRHTSHVTRHTSNNTSHIM
jgi:hypothetical protein